MTDALPIGDRPAERVQLAPPDTGTGLVGWMRLRLFSSWGNGITTVVLVFAMGWVLWNFLHWAVVTATFTAATGAECRGGGACRIGKHWFRTAIASVVRTVTSAPEAAGASVVMARSQSRGGISSTGTSTRMLLAVHASRSIAPHFSRRRIMSWTAGAVVPK